ncbi:polymorphic toxin-type HINT domain-containing protein, partial [Paenibacillus sp. Leaf72]|uniref:polymorphic toxin-type HINT domain-containing protein n=1 Tax=Paenibacillus sp. Leaf72 TaxID=1736234 RepID=UPI001F1C68F8
DLLVSSDGSKLAIDKIEKESREATVYNFEVEDFNSYFVSNLGIWVHNCSINGNPVPTKSGGGSDPNNFVNEHAKKHMYDPSRPSTKNKSQYGQDVDVNALRTDTMINPDKAYSNWPNPNNPNSNRITKYYKEFDGNISTPDTPTGSHRVFENVDNPKSSSHFPYVPRNKE